MTKYIPPRQPAIFTVKEPTTLLPFIMQVFPGISRSKAKAILSGGGITVDKRIERQFDCPLQTGQTVTIARHKPSAPVTNRFIKIVYEDQHLVVVEKNPGILSMASNHHAFSVKSLLDEYFHRSKQRCTAHVVHRLDRDTSGLLVYAKTIQAEQILEHNWHDIVTDRRYMALVSGSLSPDRGMVESWLKDNKACFTLSYPQDPGGGKYAVTHYRQVKRGVRYSLVELKLETGRKNQIRVHMQLLGHPVCGDIKYGNGDDPAHRLCLHAFRLHFYHPITRELMRFECPVPKSFNAALSGQEGGPDKKDVRREGENSDRKH